MYFVFFVLGLFTGCIVTLLGLTFLSNIYNTKLEEKKTANTNGFVEANFGKPDINLLTTTDYEPEEPVPFFQRRIKS